MSEIILRNQFPIISKQEKRKYLSELLDDRLNELGRDLLWNQKFLKKSQSQTLRQYYSEKLTEIQKEINIVRQTLKSLKGKE